MKRIFVMGLALLATTALLATAQEVGFGQLYYNGSVVSTVVTPAPLPHGGSENFYGFPPPGGAAGQLPVVATAPGASGYAGGKWAFHTVTWNVTPYLLTSESAVLAAYNAGDVTITRIAANDFLCPIQK